MPTKDLNEAWVKACLSGFFERCEAAKAAGGIPHMAVVDRRALVPDGWWFDEQTSYYLPPEVSLFPTGVKAVK